MGKKAFLIMFILISMIAGCSKDPSPVISDTETATIAGEVVNVREKPGTSYSIITQIHQGETYPVIDKKNDWIEIKLDSEETGWIAGWLATVQAGETIQKAGVVTVQQLNVRSKPSTDSEAVGTLQEGDTVHVLDEENGWMKIFYHSSTAWVSDRYIQIQANEQSENHSRIAENIMVLHDDSNVRKKPDIQSNIVGQAHAGEIYQVLDEQDGWFQIETTKGKKGYIPEWIVSSTDRPAGIRKNGKGLSDQLIVIDAGHGGHDQGAAGINGTIEKELTLETAKLLKKKLEKAGADILLTRSSDQYVPLQQRTMMAAENEADAFISLHYDSIEEDSASGHTTYYYYAYEKRLADTIHSHLSKAIKLKDRGSNFGNYYVMRENTQPAVLLELGYLSNEEEEQLIKTKKYREMITDAIVEGLKDYYD
ncbi:N-acetylmuramoyl-L-alanine amidase [Siminovitchia sediminis]|uniref:N-acetylmuramoyl-L-alanine amidase n=1 Tax=Siminovitchia sediminis TaxID=1274353 RepID=A0ABW4KBB8_9BACI